MLEQLFRRCNRELKILRMRKTKRIGGPTVVHDALPSKGNILFVLRVGVAERIQCISKGSRAGSRGTLLGLGRDFVEKVRVVRRLGIGDVFGVWWWTGLLWG